MDFFHALIVASNIINASMLVYSGNSDKPKRYWLHSLVLSVLTGFGGGIVAPMLMSRPALVMSNDAIIPMFIVIWYLINYVGFFALLEFTPIKCVWYFLLGLFRTHSCIRMLLLACSALTPSTPSFC